MVVSGEQGAALNFLSKIANDSWGYGCAVVGSSSTTWKREKDGYEEVRWEKKKGYDGLVEIAGTTILIKYTTVTPKIDNIFNLFNVSTRL